MFREDENLYKTVFYIIPDAVILIDNKGFLVGINDKVEKWLSYKEEEVVGKHMLNLPFISAKTKIIIAKKFADRMLGKEVKPYEVEFKTRDGQIKTGLIRASLIKDDQGNIKNDLVLVTDTSDNDLLSVQIADAERKYKYLFDSLPYGFAYNEMIYDKEGKVVDYVFREVNELFEKFTGLKRENVLNKKVSEVLDLKKEKEDWVQIYGQVATTRVPNVIEKYVDTLDKWYKIAIYSPQKGFAANIFYDITEEMNAKEELEDTKKHIEEKIEELSRMNEVMKNREEKLSELKQKLKK